MLGSLVGQDRGKLIILAIIVLGALAVTFGLGEWVSRIVGVYK